MPLQYDNNISFAFSPSIRIKAAQLDRLGLDIRSFRAPLTRSIQKVMAPSFQKNFQFQGRPEAWKPLADTTVEIRGSKTPILQRSGLLAKTVQQLNIWTVGIEDASIQDLPQKVWYGKVHQGGYGSPATKSLVKAKGSSGGKKTAYVPQRPFLLIQPEDVVAIEGVFMAWFIERMTMSGAFRPGL